MRDPHVDKDSPVSLSGCARSKLGARICEIIWAYEKEMSKARRCVYVAVRSRQQLIANGPFETIRLAVLRRPSAGFKHLVQAGRPQDTYEWLALDDTRFKLLWDKAASRLLSHGVTNYPGYTKDHEKRRPIGRPPLLAA